MQFDEKKFLLIVIVFGIIFLTFGTMLKAQTTSNDYVRRISFSDVTFCEYRLNQDSTEMFDFYRLSRGSPLDTVRTIYYTVTYTGCSIFRGYTVHNKISNFIEFNKKRYPAIGSGLEGTSDLDIEMCLKLENEVRKKIKKFKKI